jgi:hypothetical protein
VHRGKEQIKDFLRAAFAWSPDFSCDDEIPHNRSRCRCNRVAQ